MSFRINRSTKIFSFFIFLSVLLSGTAQLAAAESKLEVQLVWGTNGEASADAKHQPLDPSLSKKLKMFKWKKYFRVNEKEIQTSAAPQKIRLSPQCEIEVKRMPDSRYQIDVFGEGKHIRKITEKITRQDSLVIAGDDKNDCAWFILIREIP